MMKKNMKKHSFIKRTVCIILIIGCITTGTYSYCGGFGTGKCANINEFKRHARVKFRADNFVESIEFDYLELQVIEED